MPSACLRTREAGEGAWSWLKCRPWDPPSSTPNTGDKTTAPAGSGRLEIRMNNFYPEQYAKAQAGLVLGLEMTLRERLGHQKERLEANLADVNEAIAALDSNPEILKALEAVQKVSRLG